MSQTPPPETEFTAMVRAEEILKSLEINGKTLPHVSTGKNEPEGEFFYTRFISDRVAVSDMDGPQGYLSVTRIQVIAYARSQKRAFDLAALARVTLEQNGFERVGNAAELPPPTLFGASRDYLYYW